MKHILIVVVMCLSSVVASSQVRRMCIENPARHNHMTYVNVYEYDFVDVQPEFPGGERALMNFINNTREYPYHAYHNRIQGRVVVGFIVNIDGSITGIEVIKGVEESLNREAVRVISEMPKWKVGRIGGEVVPVHCILPIAFRR
ncbi:MAG: energy transducer TonB [Muribaculaceae bacterium]